MLDIVERRKLLKKVIYKLFLLFVIASVAVCSLPLNVYASTQAELVDTVYFKNAKTEKYLSLKSNKDELGTILTTAKFGIDKVNTVMKVKKLSNNNFLIQPAETTEYTAAPTSLSESQRVKLALNDGAPLTQWVFKLQKNGSYTIHPAKNTKLVLAVDTKGKVLLQKYDKTATNQQWEASKFSLKKEGENEKILEYGIDVSKWQGDINWQAVKEYGVSFAILNIGYSRTDEVTTKDSKFDGYYDAAKSQGIKLGAYIYSYALTVKEAKNDAKTVLEYLNGRKLEYPIFYDIEDKTQEKLSRKLQTNMCLAFVNAIKEAGYNAGVYASESWFDDRLDKETLNENGEMWLAKWPQSKRADQDHSDYDIWQYRDNGQVAGISGAVDMDVAFRNYDFLEMTYTGNPITPKYDMFDAKGNLLTEGVDYKVTYKNNVNVGTATVNFVGIKKYKGKFSAKREFKIIPKSINSAVVTGATNSKRYTGTYVTPKKQIKVKLGNTKLVLGKDYTIKYKNNRKIGTAKAIIKGIGNYSGSQTFEFQIIKAKLSSATIEGIEDKVHTETQRKLSLKLTLPGTTLKQGKDYTVTYKNNVDFGKATVIIKAKGSRVSGKVTKTFNIVPQTPNIVKVTGRTTNQITLTWTHSDYATRYQLFRSTSKDGKYERIYSSPSRWVYTYTDTGLKEGTHYYYKIRAYKKVNGKKYYGAFSEVVKTNTRLSDTTFITKRNIKKGSVKIQIDENKKATGYSVYIGNTRNGKFKKVWSGTDLTYTHRGLEKGKVYYIMVRTYKKTKYGTINGNKTQIKGIRME